MFLLSLAIRFAMFAVIISFQLMILRLLYSVLRILRAILKIEKTPHPTSSSTAVAVSILLDGKKGPQMVQVSDSGKVTASIELDDARGNAVPGAALDASPAPAWSLDDPSFGDLAPSADGLSCVFSPNGKLGGPVHMLFSGSLGGNAVSATSDDIQVAIGAPASVKMSLAVQ